MSQQKIISYFLKIKEAQSSEQIFSLLSARFQELEGQGDSLKWSLNTQQITGAAIVACSGFLATFTGGLGIPAASILGSVGAAIYASGTLQEGFATTKFRPIPGNATDVMSIVVKSNAANRGLDGYLDEESLIGCDYLSGDALTGYSYLMAREKAEYCLLFHWGTVLSEVLAQLPPSQRPHFYRLIVNRVAHQYRRDIAIQPESIAKLLTPAQVQTLLTPTAVDLGTLTEKTALKDLPPAEKLEGEVSDQFVPPIGLIARHQAANGGVSEAVSPAPPAFSQPTGFPTDAISRVVGNTAMAASTPIAPPTPEPELIAHSPSAYTRSLFSLLADNPFLCYYIVASQRTGKTTSAAAASLQAKRDFGTQVYYINLNDHNQGNREAFAHADRVCVGNISGGNVADRKSLVNDAILLIEEFHQSNNAILVIDEWMALGAKGKALLDSFWAVLADKAEALASNGVGCGRAIWALAPYFKAENIRSEAKCVKNYTPYVLAIAPEQEVVWRNPNNGAAVKLNYRGEVIGQIKNNWADVNIAPPTAEEIREWKQNGITRIFWADGEWSGLEPAPTMPIPQTKKPEPPTATVEGDAIAHCGKKLWEVVEQRIAAGDRAALVTGELIIEQSKTNRLKALSTAIYFVAPTKTEFDRVCGVEYGAIFEELMGVRL
jgi:hypothetical protein